MEFVQIIDFESDRLDDVRALMKEFETDTPMSDTKVTRATYTSDRDHPNHHLALVEFGSYDDAMANNDDPRVQRLAERMTALCTSPPKYLNLDVVDRMTPSG